MGLRICLVTPFAWPQPHDVNEHVEGVAAELRRLGHTVTILAPSNRATDLLAGRRALQNGADAEVIALGPAVPISRRSRIGLPVGVRANLAFALARGRFDIVHGFEPALPSLSYLALREAHSLAVATFFSPERLAYPPARTQRERLLGRVDALIAVSDKTARAAAERFPGEYRVISVGVDPTRHRPGSKQKRIVVEWRPLERPLARAIVRALRDLPDWELVLLRTKPLSGRPSVPPLLRGRVRVRTARTGQARAELLAEASIFVPAPSGLPRVRLEASAAGAAIAAPQGMDDQPELAAAAVARLAEDEELRARLGHEARRSAEEQSFAAVARELDAVYGELAARKRDGRRRESDRARHRQWIVCDLHLHTSWSHDCGIEVADVLDYAEANGIGALAITDHNAFGGALEAIELARGRPLMIIPGEEIRTDGQGEIIGLFLSEEIPRGLPFAEAIAAVRAQGGLVYLPHPFDRFRTVPEAATLHRHLADIDVLEVYNARALFDADNDEALRFARKYNFLMGAGSDAHVVQGLGTGAVRMRAFEGPEEFLLSLRTAEILRRPKSLAYLQSLKWMAQVKERVR
jgi:predicted metal-dependent phosphoesterase TrpH/glycosyltransferase involved in cell wall biosynthesis